MIAPSPLSSALMSTAHPARRPAPSPNRRPLPDPAGDVAIRMAERRDAAMVDALEQLDGRTLTRGPRLVAELGGVPVAAIAVADDTVVSDPFARTAGVIDLLRVRARQLRVAA